MDEAKKEKEANYIFASKLLDDLNVKGTRGEYEELKGAYLQGKVTLESWERYWKEHPQEETQKDEGRDKAEIIWDSELKDYELVEKEWLIEGLIPVGGIGVWTGNRATFKSFLVLNASYCISNGLNFLGKYPTKKGRVIYLDKENGIPIMQKRSKMIKTGLEIKKGDVGFICFSQLRLDNMESVGQIEEFIKEEKPSLLIIDTYRRAISFDENDAGKVSELFVNILRPIVDENRNLSIILIHHNRKGGGRGDKMDEIRGSSDLANYCDFILLNNRKGKNVILEQLKNRNAPELKPIFVKIETDEDNFITFIKGDQTLIKTTDQRAVEELLLWITTQKIKHFKTGEWVLHATAGGFKKNSYSNAINSMVDAGKLEKTSKGEYTIISDSQETIA